jgi:histidine triad (HIT) family protein
MASIFTQIIQGEIPCYKIAEDENFIAFLDITPIVKGHVLVVPKQECDKIFDANIETLSKWLVFAQPIAKAIEKTFPCKRCGISVIGLEVPHAHMHLVPINSANDLNFTRDKLTLSMEEMKEIQHAILLQL